MNVQNETFVKLLQAVVQCVESDELTPFDCGEISNESLRFAFYKWRKANQDPDTSIFYKVELKISGSNTLYVDIKDRQTVTDPKLLQYIDEGKRTPTEVYITDGEPVPAPLPDINLSQLLEGNEE